MYLFLFRLVSGLDNAGKSSVLDKWIRTTSSTLSSNPSKIQSQSQPQSTIKLNFWDIGGQKSIRPFWRNYYEETDAIVWVIDSTDSDRLEICKNELESVLNADVNTLIY